MLFGSSGEGRSCSPALLASWLAGQFWSLQGMMPQAQSMSAVGKFATMRGQEPGGAAPELEHMYLASQSLLSSVGWGRRALKEGQQNE